jgi:hypothetical protein
MAGQYTTDKSTNYFNVRLTRDAKHFPKKDDQGAATYISFVDGTKGGEDIFIDAKVKRGAELMAALKKGDIVCVRGCVEFSTNPQGRLVGKIHDAHVNTTVKLKERQSEVAAEADAPPPETPPDDGSAPAFD